MKFPSLIADDLSGAPSKKRIAIVTPDIAGPICNGGVGSAFQCLAENLAQEGHEVTVFFATGYVDQDPLFHLWQKRYWDRGVKLLSFPNPAVPVEGSNFARIAYCAYDHLKDQSFDIIHFTEMTGVGLYCLEAKKQGLAFQNTLLTVIIHGPTEWHRTFNQEFLNHPDHLFCSFAEKRCAELADVLIPTSQFIARWIIERGWVLPARVFVEQNLTSVDDAPKYEGSRKKFDEIVFFSRLEYRKGLHIFCDAMDQLPRKALQGKTITFLGVNGSISGVNGLEYIKKRKVNWPAKVRLLTDANRMTALEYLRSRNALAILPSLSENMPYVGIECLFSKIPFLASRIPAFEELVASEDQSHVLFENTGKGLASKLIETLRDGVRPVKFEHDQSKTLKNWMKWHSRIRIPKGTEEKKGPLPLVSVCIVHRDRPRYLEQCIESFLNQTYQNFEIILVDNNSQKPNSHKYLNELDVFFREKGWTLIRETENHGPGKARNIASGRARGKYLIFSDDDNIAKAQQIEIFVKAMESSDLDIATCLLDVFRGAEEPAEVMSCESRWLFIGAGVAAGLFTNVYGDMACIVRRETYEELGGLIVKAKPGYEDYEFFARAVMRGKKLAVIPEALVWYRRHSGGGLWQSEPYRIIKVITDCYAECLVQGTTLHPQELKNIFEYIAYFNHSESLHLSLNYKPQPLPPVFNPARSDFFLQRGDFKKKIFVSNAKNDFEDLHFSKNLLVKRLNWGKGSGPNKMETLIIEDKKGGLQFSLPKLDFKQSKRVRVEVELVGLSNSHLQAEYLIKEKNGAFRKETVARTYKVGLQTLSLELNAREFNGPIKIAPLASPGSCCLKSIEVLTE